MISEFFIGLALTVADWFVSLFPEWDVPSELVTFDDTVNGFIGGFGGVGVWVPWPFVIFCAGAYVLAWGISLAIKSARWLVGLIPTMGGGT